MKLIFHRAESLIETLIAVFVISLSAVAALTLMITTMQTIDNVQDRVIAVNLSREGIEAVRNIRESNWLEHSRERREHWNCLGMRDCDNSKEANLIQNETNYTVDFDENFRWTLTEVATDLDLEDLVLDNEDYRLYLKNYEGGEFYTHDSGLGANTETKFYRQVSVRYVDEDEDVMEVKSNVSWFAEGERVAHIELTTYLTDFLGRELIIK